MDPVYKLIWQKCFDLGGQCTLHGSQLLPWARSASFSRDFSVWRFSSSGFSPWLYNRFIKVCMWKQSSDPRVTSSATRALLKKGTQTWTESSIFRILLKVFIFERFQQVFLDCPFQETEDDLIFCLRKTLQVPFMRFTDFLTIKTVFFILFIFYVDIFFLCFFLRLMRYSLIFALFSPLPRFSWNKDKYQVSGNCQHLFSNRVPKSGCVWMSLHWHHILSPPIKAQTEQ